MEYKIPVPLVAVIADVFSSHYTHTEIDSRFFAAGFPADVPPGNKQQKCHAWLLRANQQIEAPLLMVGHLIEELMETVPPPTWGGGESPLEAHRARISAQLSALGLCYQIGGHFFNWGPVLRAGLCSRLCMIAI
ncbi:hypothetical protein [Tunturiibacter gelidoferens]|uniref:Uncharacterized protein n=1 Tax=Tunturiibacter lichenicola TaxID=2051959 RepID=A0A7Y9NIB3_9BACT|nr:hypothetical protein [Edaphobacter lichenicola]NYF49762.1 hypothetical protein [Edaphobacter lichenicola]